MSEITRQTLNTQSQFVKYWRQNSATVLYCPPLRIPSGSTLSYCSFCQLVNKCLEWIKHWIVLYYCNSEKRWFGRRDQTMPLVFLRVETRDKASGISIVQRNSRSGQTPWNDFKYTIYSILVSLQVTSDSNMAYNTLKSQSFTREALSSTKRMRAAVTTSAELYDKTRKLTTIISWKVDNKSK